ncbi:hypothetical protein ErPhphiEa104_gp069 [Erwinia phage phiEa104]|uniref:Uncharacterized protein n=3 Tax=Kolesnikvirus Ea214 TaxID=1965384 RepID=A0A346FHW0_9CAUD|nr:hypothetical protein ErPhphiEa104_gp069 [Erwinia phage phiEa104]AXN57390.1 hypothetical protein SUNLIREN_90 [Erwinia phage SunLIRen]AYD79573.1 hypothetical protein LINGLNFE_00065 [Enterobacter phage phi63_307]WJN64972.1 hypothetical protein Erwinia_phage_Tian_00057 [Erwinia phage Tian]CBX44412.1 conserved hypothetical protein [Erwinia phage phiEa104]
MARPNDPVVSWATADVDNEGSQLKVAPPSEIQASGLLRGEPMGRQWFNYTLNNLSQYIKYLDSVVNPTKGTSTATHEIRMSAVQRSDWAASGWKLIKTVTDSTTSTGSIYYYEHTGA